MSEHLITWDLMNRHVFNLQSAFILHHRPYKETSLILEVLTRDFGTVSILAKGVRRPKSKIASLMRPFLPLTISCSGKSELKTLTQVEGGPSDINLTGLALYCGFYINELVSCFLHKHDPHPDVFADYQQCLQQLSNSVSMEQHLRLFELNLMQHVGYGFQLDYDFQTEHPVAPEKKYRFVIERGVTEEKHGKITGKTLLALAEKKLNEPETLSEAKKLMRQMIDFHLQGKELKSRAIISQIIKQL